MSIKDDIAYLRGLEYWESSSHLVRVLDELERLCKLFDDAGQGEYNVLALVDHYQSEMIKAEEERDEARAEVRRLRSMMPITSGGYPGGPPKEIPRPRKP